MKRNSSFILIALLVITQVMSYFKITGLEREIEKTSNYIWSLEDNVNARISSIYSNVDEKLEEQASYMEHIELTVGSPNAGDLTVPITYTLIPKEVSDKTTLSLEFDGELLEMGRDGTKFSLTKVTEIFNSELYPNIVITEGDMIKTEQNDLLHLSSVKNDIFPELSLRLLGSASSRGQLYRRTGTITSDIRQSKSGLVGFTDARLVIKVDDFVVEDKPIELNRLYNYEIDEEIALEDGETCIMYIIVKDSLNLEHHYQIDHYIQGNKAQREPFFNDEKIYTQDGTLLWSQENNS